MDLTELRRKQAYHLELCGLRKMDLNEYLQAPSVGVDYDQLIYLYEFEKMELKKINEKINVIKNKEI